MGFTQYSPDRVKVNVGGRIITGFADGTFIEIERNEDAFMTYVGALGDVTRARNMNKTGKITITIMQHAPSNDLLMSLLVADSIGDTLPFEITVKDLTNNMRCHAAEAWISKAPKIERGKEAAGIQWVFECANLEIVPSTPELV